MGYDICILAIAQGIDLYTIDRFVSCVNQARNKRTIDFYIDNRRPLEDQFNKFNKSNLLNMALRKLIKRDYQVIIQTDIDVIIPPRMIDECFDVAMGGKIFFHNDMVRIDPETDPFFKFLPDTFSKLDWDKYKVIMQKHSIDATGCFNIMQRRFWAETGGWNEEMCAHGREDDMFAEVIKKYTDIVYINSKKYPLLHYNHPPRTKDNRRMNDRVRNKYRKTGFKQWL
jgi:hypothetical protein